MKSAIEVTFDDSFMQLSLLLKKAFVFSKNWFNLCSFCCLYLNVWFFYTFKPIKSHSLYLACFSWQLCLAYFLIPGTGSAAISSHQMFTLLVEFMWGLQVPLHWSTRHLVCWNPCTVCLLECCRHAYGMYGWVKAVRHYSMVRAFLFGKWSRWCPGSDNCRNCWGSAPWLVVFLLRPH